ncbi:MAG: Histidine kinase, gyrase and HSP90-like ATPase [Modestobacter sp.]|nr:Histidine kinase, gyrase and HSP90-like ATPase [Modestobacter sp.]HEV7870856.1 histidine kinase [Modestobacter sp.]
MTRITPGGTIGAPPAPGSSVRGSVTRFALAGLIAAVMLAALIGVLARQAGAVEATRSFERLASVIAGGVIAPRLTPDLLAGDPTAVERLDRATGQLLAGGPLVHLSVRDADGTVLWSDEQDALGTRTPLGQAQRRALDTGTIVSWTGEDMLTASVGVQDAAGTPRLVDLAERYDDVEANAWTVWRLIAPASLGALLLLELVQVPLALGLARRVRRHQEAEAVLLQTALDASDAERRRIAGEVHDDVVPGLAAMAYDLDADRLRTPGPPDPERTTALLSRTAEGLRGSLRQLRALLADLSPARLPEAGLNAGVGGLAARAEARGIRVSVDAPDLSDVPRPAAEVLFRCVQEALRNVTTHSRAESVEIVVTRDATGVQVAIDDDGLGFDGERLARSAETGHLGLRALGDLVADSGGSLTATSAPGQGTRLVASVPLDGGKVHVGSPP